MRQHSLQSGFRGVGELSHISNVAVCGECSPYTDTATSVFEMSSRVIWVTFRSALPRHARIRVVCRMLRSAPGHRLAAVSKRGGVTAAAAVKELAGLHTRGRCAAAAQAAALGDSRTAMLLAVQHPACPPSAVRALAAARSSRVVHTTGSARGAAAWTARNTQHAGPVPSWRLRRDAWFGDDSERWFAASDPGCPAVLLDRLRTDPDTRIRFAARRNPSHRGPLSYGSASTPAADRVATGSDKPADGRSDALRRTRDEIEVLACSNDWIDRGRAASDRDTPGGVLEHLSVDTKEYVRKQVARNRSCPPALLERLAASNDPDVRAAVAANTASPAELLASLVSDPRGEVRAALAGNESSPPLVLTRLTVENPRGYRRQIAANPSASPRLLAELAQDNDYKMRKRVAANPSCPRSVLGWLRHDTSLQVAETAERR